MLQAIYVWLLCISKVKLHTHSIKFKPSRMLRCVNFLKDHSVFEMSELLAQRQWKLESTETPLWEPQISHHTFLLLCRYNSDTVLAFSTTSFHLRQSYTCSTHFISFIFFRSFLTSSSHPDLGLPAGLPVNGFHLCILFTMLVSGILFMCPNQLNRWALT